MNMEISTNRSDIFIHVHPCYKLDMLNVLFSNPSAVCFLFHVFLSSLSAATVCGNLLVILSIAYFKQLQTPSNALVLSLAVADLLVGIIVFPLSIAFPLTPCIFHHDVFCAVRGTFEVCLCTASILNLCCISIDRYYAVCRPLSYKTRMNDNVVLVMILLSWTVSALVGLEQFYIYFLILFCTYYLVTWSFFLCGWMGVCVCVCACTVTCSSGPLVVTTCTSSPQRRDHSLTDMESLQFLVLHRHTRPPAFGSTAHSQSVCYWPVTGAVSAPGSSFPHF
uniref:G-protein coupled receptors family 1 profile domain-containing protein n=1 Tax=Cynoglossus semilaevis TaxID=244447 RepID=A0A3P8VVB7_CYNSE